MHVLSLEVLDDDLGVELSPNHGYCVCPFVSCSLATIAVGRVSPILALHLAICASAHFSGIPVFEQESDTCNMHV